MEEKIACFVQTVRRRNLRETGIALPILALFGFSLLAEPRPALEMAGRLIIILAGLGALGVIWRRLHIPASEAGAYPPAQTPSGGGAI